MTDKIMKFGASWCAPCKSLSKTLENMDISVPIENIDIDESSDVAVKYVIRNIPTMIYFADGVERSRLTGSPGADAIKKWIVEVS